MDISGGTAAIDICLSLLSEVCGSAAADLAARQLVSAPLRYGDQKQIIERPLAISNDNRPLVEHLEHLKTNLDKNHRADTSAATLNMSVRTFTRKFKQITGTTFLQWLLAQRLAYAQQLLESSGYSIESVVTETGFGSALSLRKHFKQALGITPTEYRKKWVGSDLWQHYSKIVNPPQAATARAR